MNDQPRHGRRLSWREELQNQLDINNEMRAMSVRRVGDSVSERAAQAEWVGRVREVAK